jgi:flagellar M-ring protein FliF
VVRHTVKPRGDIARLSVAVVVDDDHQVKTDAAGKTTRSAKPRSAGEMQKIQQIVATAVGLDSTRGDQITVENVAFDDNTTVIPDPTFFERIGPSVREYSNVVVVLILGLAALLFVVRPIIRASFKVETKLPAPIDTAPLPPAQSAKTIEEIEGEIEAQLDAKAAAHLADRNTPVLQRRVVKVVQDEPENAARLVRSWLLEDKA